MRLETTIDLLDSKIERCLIEEDQKAYLYDPYFDIVRNRVSAEYCKGLIKLDRKENIIRKMIDFLIENQNENGSWNEIHANYDEPSSLITSIVGDALIEWYKKHEDRSIRKSIESAKNYVLSNERGSGYFIKSKKYHQDHLNVDATCADFLSSYGRYFSDVEVKKAAQRTVEHIKENQFDNGIFPYRVDTGGEKNPMKVPCIHYQGVTIYYLKKAMKDLDLEDAGWLRKATGWLAETQKRDGRFDWSESGLMFAYRLTGAYAFAYSSYNLIDDLNHDEKAVQCLKILNENIDDLVLRWERSYDSDILASFFSVLKSSNKGNEDLIDFLHKTGYGYYREISRRRFTENPKDDILFETINDIFSLKSSTIEPSKNYPDLFMTTECFDCLSYVHSYQGGSP